MPLTVKIVVPITNPLTISVEASANLITFFSIIHAFQVIDEITGHLVHISIVLYFLRDRELRIS